MYYKNIFININTASWSDPSEIPINFRSELHNFNLSEVLFRIGLITRHPEAIGLTLNSLWAFFRYYHCFVSDSRFKLNQQYSEIDSHQKAILSDDFGMGFASYYLTRKLDLINITDTSYFLKHLDSLEVYTPPHGKPKIPDFILLDSDFNLHVLECKGTQSSNSYSNQQIRDGRTQKSNIIDPDSIIEQRLVTGIFIPSFEITNDAEFKIADPEFSIDFSKVSKKSLVFKSLQSKLVNELQLIGLSEMAIKLAKTHNLREVNLDSLLSKLKEHENVSIRVPYNSNIKWEITYDISFLRDQLHHDIYSLHDLCEYMYENAENISIRDESTRDTDFFNYKSLFGLVVTINEE